MFGKTVKRRSGPRLLLLAAVFAVAALAVAGSASGTGKYTDPTGDSGSAPDIAGATVSSGSNGQITFRLTVANLPSSGDVQTILSIDSDANPDTGNLAFGGADYLFVVDQESHSFGFAHWTGSDWDLNAPDLTVQILTASDGLLVSVNRSELGNTGQLNFWVLTMTTGGGPGKSDTAPADGLWNYDLQATGPAIQEVQVQTTPASPKAGKAFSVSVVGLKLPPTGAKDVPQPESYSCTAKLGSKILAAGGANRCTFKIPKKKARGKRLVVAVTVQYQGVTKTVEFPFTVR